MSGVFTAHTIKRHKTEIFFQNLIDDHLFSDGQDVEYLPITSNLTKIRVHNKNALPQPQKEIICYPITNISRPLDLFAPFPKNVPSFIPLNPPPPPPSRHSSKTSTALKVYTEVKETKKPCKAGRHEACFQTDYFQRGTPSNKYGTITIRKQTKKEPIVRSKSAGPICSTKVVTTSVKEETNPATGTRISRKQQTYHVSSVSPGRPTPKPTDLRKSSPSPVAFGRSISKERTFAEEKKRLEETLPLCRKSFTASTSILRDPSLKSPDEVKRAVRSYAQPLMRSKSAPKKIIPTSGVRSSSYLSASAKKNITSNGKKEEKSMRMAVSTSSNGKDPRKDSKSISKSASQTPSTIKSTVHSSRVVEKKTPKESAKTSSTLSLARTSSTFSIDSNGSKKKTPKKPKTITRPGSRERTVPITLHGGPRPKLTPPKDICQSRSDSNVLQRVKETVDLIQPEKIAEKIEKEIQRDISDAILQHQEAVRSDHFFQNLFLRDSSPPMSIESNIPQTVQEKTRYWNTLCTASEPSLRRTCAYLSQRRPVTDSKFLSLESKRFHQSRSLSPTYRRPTPKGRHVREQVSKFDSFYQLSDEESEFGDGTGRAEEIIYKFEQRSSSEPRTRTVDTSRSSSPSGKRSLDYPRVFTPTREVRSPSRRRIESFRDSQKSETKKVIRANSLSSADDRSRRGLYECSEMSHSTSSLNFIERHGPNCRLRNSDRFIDLNRFYNNLERVGQLERATSSTDLRPIRKEGELIDFDEWKKLRAHEKAEKELHYLVGKLKQDQREKDFLFRPKDVEDVKWSEAADSGLRCKEKSVEDLRESFEKKIQEDGLDEIKKLEIESEKDIYRPYWRGTSVADSATNMLVKYSAKDSYKAFEKPDKRLCLSNRLISTLSREQVSKIKNQLNEIYSISSSSGPKEKCAIFEDYVITVDEDNKGKINTLKVRSNSTISKEELLGPMVKRKESQSSAVKSESTSSVTSHSLPPRPPAQSKTFERISKQVSRFESELSEIEKKKLSQSISREVQDKVTEKKRREDSPVILARETFGAVAAENAKRTLPETPPPPPPPQEDYLSIDYTRSEVQTDGKIDSAVEKVTEKKSIRMRKTSVGETESNESDVSKTTVIYKEKTTDGIQNKIKYFEEKKEEEPPKTIYHAREYSSPDEEEIFKAIEEKMKAKEREVQEKAMIKHQELSSSLSDFKELFGEKESSRVNFPIPRPPPPPDENYDTQLITRCRSSSLSLSDGSSSETTYRSRSVSPTYMHKTFLNRIHTGDVKKIKDKFESLHEQQKQDFFELGPLRKIRSDPELNKIQINPHKITIRDHEVGDVSWITHKFEIKNKAASRGRSRTRRVISPIPRVPLRKEDRLMPHIDIISKTASLKREITKSPSPTKQQALHSGEVERIRCKFESPDRTSLIGQMYTSSPDISELKDISTYLTGSWIAHKYPKPRDNARSPTCPEKGPESEYVRRRPVHRSCSTSPPRSKTIVTSILKPYYDIFADQKFDPVIHRPKSRYVPDNVDDLWKKVQNGFKKPSTVKFEGYFIHILLDAPCE